MKIALIPPIPELERMPVTGIHLLLSHLLTDDRYRRYYRERSAAGDYIILDNSAHEFGAGGKPNILLDQTIQVQADEVVCPDVLFDANATIEATRGMLSYIEMKWEHYEAAGSPRLMMVPQGTNRAEWVKCLHGLLRAWDRFMAGRTSARPVIGVSKDYDNLVKGGITSLISQYLTAEYEVHCLGWPANLWALADVKEECPWVRSTDSAKSYVYAMNGVLLEPGGKVPVYPRRPQNYFQATIREEHRWIVERNVEVFRSAATGDVIV